MQRTTDFAPISAGYTSSTSSEAVAMYANRGTSADLDAAGMTFLGSYQGVDYYGSDDEQSVVEAADAGGSQWSATKLTRCTN